MSGSLVPANKRSKNMERLEAIALAFPEAERVDIEAWDGHPTFRVRGKNFVFADRDARHLSLKLTREEAAAVVASDARAEPAGYGLGRHGWVALSLPARMSADAWSELAEWVDMSYRLVAPRRLVAQLDEP
jgi:predicted DNA-binding protein (MmcQ/YjbR family)